MQEFQNGSKTVLLLVILSILTPPGKVFDGSFEILMPELQPQQAFSLKLFFTGFVLHLPEQHQQLLRKILLEHLLNLMIEEV